MTRDSSPAKALDAPDEAREEASEALSDSQTAPSSTVRRTVRKWTDRLLGRDRTGASQASERDPNIYPLF